MGQKSIKLRLQPLEERMTPASIAVESAQTMAQAATIAKISEDPRWLVNPALRSVVTRFSRAVFNQSEQMLAAISSARGTGPIPRSLLPVRNVAIRNSNFAEMLGKRLNFDVDPPVVRPPVVTPPSTTDSGMTNALPDVNSPNWVTRANGLKTWDVVTGTGDPVATGDSITIFYTGWLLNGQVFDSRRSPSPAITFSLASLIQGWQQGIPGMKPGGIRRLYIPAALAYGANGSPPSIPANADIVFEIKVISHT